jgi:plasmid stabilization system protein ParE
VVAKGFNIHWENEAKLHLKQACAYIRKDSVQNALKVKKEILDIITTLSIYPEKYSLDKYKKNNDGSYRSFEKHHYRIAYRVSDNKIIILMIRHTSMQPLEH